MEHNHINYIFNNFSIDSDKLSNNINLNYQYGGQNKENINEPNGGFPPIYKCETFDTRKNNIKREYVTHKNTVSIKNIMEERRKAIPFININN